MFQTKVAKKIKTHILSCNVFPENCAFFQIMWENMVEWGQATDDKMAHAHCMLYT